MVSLIVYAVAIGGLVLGVFGIIHSHDSKIRLAERALWEPQVTACKANEKTAVDANQQIQKDFQVFKEQTQQQRDSVDRQLAAETKARNEADAWIQGHAPRIAAAERDLATLKGIQATAKLDAKQSCEIQRTVVSKALDDEVAARLKWIMGLPK